MNISSRTIVQLADGSPQVVRLLNQLAARGWKVHLICYNLPPKAAVDRRVQVHKLPISPAYPLTYAAFLAAAPMILGLKPDVIHAHYLTRFGILAAVYRRFLRFKPMLLTACGSDVLVDSRKGMTRWSAEHALKMFAVVTCDSDQVADALHDLDAPKGKIERAYLSEEAVDHLEAIYLRLIEDSAKNRS
jgi:hypothetical protein